MASSRQSVAGAPSARGPKGYRRNIPAMGNEKLLREIRAIRATSRLTRDEFTYEHELRREARRRGFSV